MRQAVYCALAEAGAEGPLRPFGGTKGVLAMLGLADERVAAGLEGRLAERKPLHRAGDAEFKSWPVESRAQTAIQAAFDVRAALAHPWQIERVVVHADAASVAHLVREDAYAPRPRETADHSSPYVVASALLDGRIEPRSFQPDRYENPALRGFLADRVTVVADADRSQGAAAGFPARLEVKTVDARSIERAVSAARGHSTNPFSDAELDTKVHAGGDAVLGADATSAIIGAVRSLDDLDDLRMLSDLLVA